ncbi:hypothetical protein Tco_0749048 [Tanacetum coccineum]|uniref:Uncharacterized protein n=1 Tax=Tanacetum coccineum TaxID=301880 RepID=A0ABQ4Z032_9ASTR
MDTSKNCPKKLKEKDRGNGNAQGWVYAVGMQRIGENGTGNPEANVVIGSFLATSKSAKKEEDKSGKQTDRDVPIDRRYSRSVFPRIWPGSLKDFPKIANQCETYSESESISTGEEKAEKLFPALLLAEREKWIAMHLDIKVRLRRHTITIFRALDR